MENKFNFLKAIMDTYKIYQANGSGYYKIPDEKLIKSYNRTKRAADKLSRKCKIKEVKLKNMELTP